MHRLLASFVVLTACGDAAVGATDTSLPPDAVDARDTALVSETAGDGVGDAVEVPEVAEVSDAVEVPEVAEVSDAAEDAIHGLEILPEVEPPAPIPLVDVTLWRLVPDAEDPFLAQRPVGLVCDETGIVTEAGTLEIRTELCDWPTLEQPLLVDVAAADTLEVIFFFGPLIAPEPGAALVEMRLGGQVLWQKTFAIPSTGGFVIQNITPPRAFTAGEQVLFHLHNHGANTWNLASVAILGSE